MALPLLGEDVHDDGAVADFVGVAERLFEALDVMAVERPGVADPELLEERGRLPHLAHGRFGCFQTPLELVAEHRGAVKHLLQPGLLAQVPRVQPQPGQAFTQPGDGGGVGAAVVVEHDDGPTLAVAEVVQALVRHPAGHGAVADDRDHPSAVALVAFLRRRQSLGVAHHGRGVAVLDPVVIGLLPGRVARQAAGLAQVGEARLSAGHDLVDVGLMAGVPQDDVVGGIEDPVEGQGEFDRAEIGAQVTAAGRRHRVDDEIADLHRELVEILIGEVAQVSGTRNGLEHRAS